MRAALFAALNGSVEVRRLGGRLRSYIVAAAAVVLLAAPVSADRLLSFTVVTEARADVATASVNADGMVVLRLRSKNSSGLARKAEVVASRLTDLALEGLKPGEIEVARVDGQWSVTGAGKLIVTADTDTAEASGLEAKSLCESWRKRLRQLLEEPYLCVMPNRLLVVPYNETRTIRFGGTAGGETTVESMAPGVARTHREAGRAVVHGAGVGTTVVIIEAGEAHAAITIEVKKWAARVAARAVLSKLPGGLPEPMRQNALLNAALSAVDPEPRASVRISNLSASRSGYSVSLQADGVEYLPISRNLSIAVREEPSGMPAARMLALSNYPERVTGTGALMRQRLATKVPTRLMWHHKNYAGRPIVTAVRLVNAGAEPARIRLGWAEAGPNPDEIYVGYNAMVRYWESVRRGAGFVAAIPPGNAFETSAMRMKPHDVVSGLMDLLADAGENLYIELVAREPAEAPGGFSLLPGNADQLPVTPYAFPATLESEVDYEVGGRFGHLSIGRENLENDEGFILAGAYGVNHLITVNASNPTGEMATLELALRAGGGVARTVTVIDGAINSSGILSAGHEQLLDQRPLPPGGAPKLQLENIPTAGSNLPFTLVVRSRTR